MPEVPAGLLGLAAQAQGGGEGGQEGQDHASQQRHRPVQDRPGEPHNGYDQEGGQEAADPGQHGDGEVVLQGAPEHGQVRGQGAQVQAGAPQEHRGAQAQGLGPRRQVRAPGVEAGRVTAQLALLALGVQLGQGGGGLHRGRCQEEHEHEDAGAAERAPQEDPGDHEDLPPGAVTVRNRRGRRIPASRRIHIIPAANRPTTTSRTTCPWALS